MMLTQGLGNHMELGMKKAKHSSLILFNLSLDLNNSILSFTHDWAMEFSKHFEQVIVFSTHTGKFSLPKNVRVIEIGGGSFFRRVRGVMILLTSVAIVMKMKRCVVFHHMSTKTLIFPGILFELMRIRQGAWYSHSHADRYLRLSSKFSYTYFTASELSFPLENCFSRVKVIGHGIDYNHALPLDQIENSSRSRDSLLFVGRISRIKRIENAILALSILDSNVKKLDLLGPITDPEYITELLELAKVSGININFLGEMSRERTQKTMNDYEYLFSDTPKSTDKSALEAAGNGIFVISTNRETLSLCGVLNVYKGARNPSVLFSLSEQLRFLGAKSEESLRGARIEIARMTRNRNSLNSTVWKIVNEISQ